MRYKLRKEYSKDPQKAIQDILNDRGVNDIYNFCNPSADCELNPYNLKNIEAAAQMLLRHLKRNSNILFVVDCD